MIKFFARTVLKTNTTKYVCCIEEEKVGECGGRKRDRGKVLWEGKFNNPNCVVKLFPIRNTLSQNIHRSKCYKSKFAFSVLRFHHPSRFNYFFQSKDKRLLLFLGEETLNSAYFFSLFNVVFGILFLKIYICYISYSILKHIATFKTKQFVYTFKETITFK